MPFWINIITAAVAFAVSAGSGFFLIPYLKKLHFGQTILDIGPKWHKSKEGTPTMGGFMFLMGTIMAVVIGFVIYNSLNDDIEIGDRGVKMLKLLCGILMSMLFCLIGFIDDFIKVSKKRNLGLTSKQKLVLQFLISGMYLFALYLLGDRSTSFNFGFYELDLKFFYYPLMILFITFLVNAVNLTDGIDGLCGSVTAVGSISFLMISMLLTENEQALFSVALAGACLGFLVWNLHPAKVFMGDTGSMFLGGAIVSIGMATRQHFILAIIGIVYICEALSVVLQVICYKTTGKRIFKMSPIHHHFEMSGWSEYKIVIVFSAVALIAGIISIIMVSSQAGVLIIS